VKDSITYFVKQAPVIPNPILLTKVYKDTIKFGETGKITILKNDSRSLIIPVSGFSGFAPFTSVTNNSTTADVLTFDVKTSATRTSKDTFNLKVCLVSDLNKCSNAQVIMLYLDTAKKPVAKDDYKEIKEGTSVTIEVLKNDVLHGSSIIGSTPAKNGNAVFNGNVLTYTPNTSYYGKDSLTYTICRDSCTTATVRFDITPVFYAKVVQAVSPNGDNINDVFTIEDVDYQLLDISVKIYNRWGTLVFSEKKYDANNPDKSWHGQGVDRDDLVDGTYFYVVDIPALDFKEEDYLVLIK
jgi:gliding motility-associated-like protein